MSAILRLTRETVAIELRRGTFEITIDGKDVGSIQNHETVEKPIDPGHHTLRMRAGRYSSRDFSFDVADGDAIDLRCHGAAIWPIWVASIVKPDLGITVKHA